MSREGIWIVCAVLVVVGFFGYWWQRNNGQFRAPSQTDGEGVLRLSPADLGHNLGDTLTVVQFSSTFCQPCVATKRVISYSLGLVKVEGIESIEVNAEENLELAKKAAVMRTPTVVLLDSQGREISRASGELRPQQFLGALGEALGLEGLDAQAGVL